MLDRPVGLRASAAMTDPRRYENPDDVETEAEDSWEVFEGSAFDDSVALTLLSTAGARGDQPTGAVVPVGAQG